MFLFNVDRNIFKSIEKMELMDKSTYVQNETELKQKINKIKIDGSSKLHIISDFDRTITKAFVEGQKTPTSLAQIREGKYLTKDYPEKAHALFDKYHAYEISNTIPKEERDKKMVEWWTAHLELLIKSGMNEGVVKDIIQRKKIHVREGTPELLDILNEYKIPLLIFSAGNGNVIEEYLKSEDKLYNSIHIVSNFFKFNKKGLATGYVSDKIIHTFNKNEIGLKNTPYYNQIKKRKNLILLGDSLGDLDMAEGLEHDNIIKIGFLNEDASKLFEDYSKRFDVVILNDGPMHYVNSLIKEILK